MLNDEQLTKRANAMKNVKTFMPNEGKPYVFISYRSENWNVVLNEIVRNMVNKFGLRVYYDSNFDKDNKSWCTNMIQAMESDSCKGVLAFFSKEYMNSYACALELINTKSKRIYLGHFRFMDIIPIIVDENYKSINDMKGDYDKAKIIDWSDYNNILDNVIDNKERLINKGFKDFFEIIESLKNKNQEVTFQDLASCIKQMLIGKSQEKRYLKNMDNFYENLESTIKSIEEGNSVFDESLIGSCPKEDDDIKEKQSSIDKNNPANNNVIKNDKEESNNVKTTKDISEEELHNTKVKECVIKEIEKYKNAGKLVSVGNSKSMFTTKALNDFVKCNEFDNNKTTPGNLIGYHIGFYGLKKYSWNTFTFNLGVENIENKGIVKDRIMSLIEARDKLNKEGILENLLKEAKDKALLVNVNYNNTFGKNSTNLLTLRFDDVSEDENVLIKNIDSALDWMEKFESNLLNSVSKSI